MLSKLQQLITVVINVAFFALRSIWQSKNLPLRGLIVVPFIVQIFATVTVVGYWSFDNGRQAVNALFESNSSFILKFKVSVILC